MNYFTELYDETKLVAMEPAKIIGAHYTMDKHLALNLEYGSEDATKRIFFEKKETIQGILEDFDKEEPKGLVGLIVKALLQGDKVIGFRKIQLPNSST